MNMKTKTRMIMKRQAYVLKGLTALAIVAAFLNGVADDDTARNLMSLALVAIAACSGIALQLLEDAEKTECITCNEEE